MNKRLWIVLALLGCCWAGAWAEELSESQALSLARQFVAGSQVRKTVPNVTLAGQVSGLYVFNVSSSGFVIVSNDDQTVPILAYGQDGNIDTDQLPDNMRAWLQGYADQIAWLRAQDQQGTQGPQKVRSAGMRRIDAESKANIEPLVRTNWNQGRPYYDLCPRIDGERTVTGCLATTMAQLMNYHQWPEAKTAPIPGYTTATKDKNGVAYQLTVDALPATNFDWKNMIANYTPVNPETGQRYLDGTAEQQTAVATLMQYCGAALQMSYGLNGNGGSAAYSEAMPYALKTYFGYDGGIQHCYRKNYSYAQWVDLIYGELAQERPVALGGQSAGGGHSFICDGYMTRDDADYFHINWGWAGNSDAYFLLSVLNPYEQYIGGSSTLDGFSFGQDAVIGIQKPVEGNADYCLSLEALSLGAPDVSLSTKTYSRDGATGGFTDISIYYDVWNYNFGSAEYDVALQLVDGGGEVVQTFGGSENETLTWNTHVSATISACTIPAEVANGTYYIKVMSRPHGTTAWQECFDGDAYRLSAVISGNELTIGVPVPSNITPASVNFDVAGESETGAQQTVKATVTGGDGNYAGDLILRVNGSAVMGQVAQVPAGQSVELTFTYIPSVVGDNVLTLWTRRSGGTQISGSATRRIATFVLPDNAANTSAIEANHGRTADDVRLDGRTFYKDGEWNTVCLPFDLTLEGSALAGAEARTLSSASLTDGVLTLNFGDPVATLAAGVPYIIKWAKADGYDAADPAERDIVSPVFAGVTIKSGYVDFTSADKKVQFLGRYSAYTYTQENKNTLLLGAGNALYYPQPSVDAQTGATLRPTIGAFRAYFELDPSAAASVKAFSISFGDESPTGIGSVDGLGLMVNGSGAWYDLSGRRLNGKPSQRGIYVNQGRRVVIK